jgi:hypothetical protein
MVTWYSIEDGGVFYIQDDPESEVWIGSFNNQKQAEEYCVFLNSKEEDVEE